ncbi:MAG: 2-dehydropantoate 2-reductase [Candidatus Angelobacter sp.]
MRILVVGAGAIGGYFGGRLLEAHQDVTFLVRPRRAAQLVASGLTIRSRFGEVSIPNPPAVLTKDLNQPFDLVLLGCKAYDLEDAMVSFAAAVGSDTAILPLLNGMRHIDVLEQRFGRGRVLGGQCLIAATLNEKHEIVHLNDTHNLSFGELDGSRTPRIAAIEAVLSTGRFQSRFSPAILQEMWEKWVFIASGAGLTCLMRASVGDIVSAGAADLAATLLNECSAIATHAGFPPRSPSMERSRSMLTQAGSTLTASMLRDIERLAPIEADHVIGDLLRRAGEGSVSTPLLRIAYAHLKAYEARRARESAPAGKAVSSK